MNQMVSGEQDLIEIPVSRQSRRYDSDPTTHLAVDSGDESEDMTGRPRASKALKKIIKTIAEDDVGGIVAEEYYEELRMKDAAAFANVNGYDHFVSTVRHFLGVGRASPSMDEAMVNTMMQQ